MDSKKKMITLSVILVVLIVLYILGTIFSPERIGKRGSNRPLFEQIDSAAVRFIELRDKAESSFLEKNADGTWSILLGGDQYPADTKKIEDMVAAVVGLKQHQVVSSSADTWERFQLKDDSSGIFLKGGDEGSIITLYVGDQGIRGNGNYIRLEGEDKVYLTDVSLSFYLEKGAEYWSDLDLYPDLSIGEDSVSLVSVNADITLGDNDEEKIMDNYTLIRRIDENRETWSAQNSTTPLDQQKVKNLVRALANLKGDAFISSPKNNNTGAAQAEIHFSTTENQRIKLTIGKNTGEEHFILRCSASPYVYSLSSWSVKRIVKQLDELFLKE